MTMIKSVLVGMLALAATGCVDLCAKSEDCAKKAGNTFSITECRTSLTSDREKSNTKGCSAEFSALESCLGGMTCDQLASATGAATNCGAQIDKYAKCMQ